MKFKQESIKVILVTWVHCGGWGGLILRGVNQSYNGGGMHGYYLETEYNGVFFEYNSNYYHASEQHHLVAYKDVIINETKSL